MAAAASLRLSAWRQAHAASFAPPVCNKLLHRGRLSIMAVGGPNARTDFHLDPGAEFFWQHEGELQLPIVEQQRRRLVRVRAGEVFLLPPLLPHSPQRSAASFGLVAERERASHELDGLRWYTDFESCDTVLWERAFHCTDLGRDLVPVINEFRASAEARTGRPASPAQRDARLVQDDEACAPEPFALSGWLADHAASLAAGRSLALFAGVASDLLVTVHGGPSEQTFDSETREAWVYQLKGEAAIVREHDGERESLAAGSCIALDGRGQGVRVQQERGSVGLVVAL
mmetsp:Transcript_13103/g.30192  ORF Transcript_13103/g.30192 Transcript_13103/m.30192 type:complete len:287 (-) Transcript_13103:210-1070(-)